MVVEKMGVVIEVWPIAADAAGVWLCSGADAWRSAPIDSAAEPHYELELLIAAECFAGGRAEPVVPVLVHSTSWRPGEGYVVLTYVAVLAVTGAVREEWPLAAPVPADLLEAVGNPLPHDPAGPPLPRYIDVLYHALRHLSYLRNTAAAEREVLSGHWATHLERLEPALAGMYGGVC